MADGAAFVEVVADTSGTERQMERDMTAVLAEVEAALPSINVEAALDSDAAREVMAEAERIVARAQASLPDLEVQVDTGRATEQIERFTRDATGRLHDARGRFVSESRVIGDAVSGGAEVAAQGLLGLSRAVFGSVQGLGELTQASPAVSAGLAAIGGSIGATTVATAGLGLGFAGLGVAALSGTKEVESAFTDLGSTLKAVGQAAALPLQGPLLQALDRIEAAAVELGPDLQRVFREAQPFLDAFVDGAIDAAQNALPGIEAALDGLEPVARTVQQVLGELGTALGETLEALASDPESAALVLESIGSIVSTLLPLLGDLGSVITTVVAPSLGTLAGLLEAVAPALETLIPIIGALYGVVTGQFQGALDLLQQSFFSTGDSADTASTAAKGFSTALSESVLALQEQAAKQTEATTVQGVYANAVLAVNTQLAQQRADADSLRNSLFALTDVTRGAIDAQSAYEGAIDRAREAIDKNGAVLDYQNGRLDLNSQRARDVYNALSSVARQTQDYTAKTLEASGSTDKARAVFEAGRKKLIDLSRAAGLSADEAKRLADEIIGIPPYKKVTIDVTQRVSAGPALNKPHAPETANGGIFSFAQTRLIGEAGPEVVIPLTRPQRARELAEQSGLTSILGREAPQVTNQITVMLDGREIAFVVDERIAEDQRQRTQGYRR